MLELVKELEAALSVLIGDDRARIAHAVDPLMRRIVVPPDLAQTEDGYVVPLHDAYGVALGKSAVVRAGGEPPRVVSVDGRMYAYDRLTKKYTEAKFSNSIRVVFSG